MFNFLASVTKITMKNCQKELYEILFACISIYMKLLLLASEKLVFQSQECARALRDKSFQPVTD